jgi:hypothetical protein
MLKIIIGIYIAFFILFSVAHLIKAIFSDFYESEKYERNYGFFYPAFYYILIWSAILTILGVLAVIAVKLLLGEPIIW